MFGICLALCNPIVKDQVGSSSLMCASYCGHAEVARCFIGAMVDITIITIIIRNLLCAQVSAIALRVMHFPIIWVMTLFSLICCNCTETYELLYSKRPLYPVCVSIVLVLSDLNPCLKVVSLM